MSNEPNNELPETTPGFPERTKEIRSPENRDKILQLFAQGDRWPDVEQKTGISEDAIRSWMQFDPTFQDEYLDAKARAADFHLDKIEDLAEEAMIVRTFPDWVYNQDGTVCMDEDGQPIPHPRAGELLPAEKDKAQRIRASVDARKIALEKRAPKKFGNLLKIADSEGEKLQIFVPKFNTFLGPDGLPADGGHLNAIEPDWVETERDETGCQVEKEGGKTVTMQKHIEDGGTNPYDYRGTGDEAIEPSCDEADVTLDPWAEGLKSEPNG